MNRYLFLLICILPLCAHSQSDQHFTMFMYNKLLYNPAYAGSRDVTSIIGTYRDQWTSIAGSPKTVNISIDGPVGNYMKPFRHVALGLSVTNETLGVETNTSVKAYYAYRIHFDKSVLSFGLSGGIDLYDADYSKLNLFQQNDPNFQRNINNAALPNFGAGVYWFGDNFFCSASVPNMLEDYYDKNEAKAQPNDILSREIRGYYVSGGYVYTLNETVKLLPQVLARYAADGDYQLPFSCDFNLSAMFYDRFMVGFTYRTDKSMEFIAHVQATHRLNVGYAYDYLMSDLQGYAGGAHEIVVGYDIVKDESRYMTPRFVKKF